MKSFPRRQNARGFSLIEVLVAVVLLSIGLLALASLQLNMIRASGTTKAQTIAAGLAKDRIEFLRSFTSIAGYYAITAPVAGTSETLTDASGSLGGVTFTRVTKVKRYIYNKATPAFVEMTNAQNVFTDSQVKALSSNYVTGRDFKRISVDVSWTDSNGVSSTVSMEDIVDSLDPTESGDILSASASTSGAREVEKRDFDPSETEGVIPFAVGAGTESAASNPIPKVLQGTNTVETRYDVLTYNGISGGTANIQQRVETAVVGCTCTFDSPPAATVRGYRPTYWNGSFYSEPEEVDQTGAGSYSPPGKEDPSSVGSQSALCKECCRDHHDPVGVKGATFTPRLVTKNANDEVTASSHDHYLSSAGPAWTGPVNSGKYSEACRLVRVEGIWHVAPDLEQSQFGLLATQQLSNPAYYATGTGPDDAAVTNYQNFVIAYMNQRFTNAVQSAYNTKLNSTQVTTLEGTHSMNLPSSISIDSTYNGALVTRNVSAVTKASPAVVTTSTAHTFANGDRVFFTGLGGMKQLNGKSYIIANVTSTTFQLVGVDSTLYGTFTSGGTVRVNHAKWLHSRGVFVDYLEKDALNAIDTAKSACPQQSGSGYTECVLKVLPFTSINLTELADWTSSDTGKVVVTNNDYSQSSSANDPVRGKVTFVPAAVDATTPNVNTLSRQANTALLDIAFDAISSADNTKNTDAQPFLISNPSSPTPTANTFYVGLSLAQKTGQAVNYITGVQASAACNYVAATTQHNCVVTNGTVTEGLGFANTMSIQVVGYNSYTNGTSTNAPATMNNCVAAGQAALKGFGPKNYASATYGAVTYVPKTCNDYNVTAASNVTLAQSATGTAPFTVSNPGSQTEKTIIAFPMINGDANTGDTNYVDKLTVTFGSPTATTGALSCSYDCSQFNTLDTDCKAANKTNFTFTSTCP